MNPTRSIAVLLTVAFAAAVLRAETHRFAPQTFVTTLSASHVPVLRLKSGDRVLTVTADAPTANTGPFFIEGAEPGDLLVVTLERLEPTGAVGYSTSKVSAHAVPSAALSRRPDTNRYLWHIDKARGIVRLDLQTALPRVNWRTRFDAPAFEMPLRPTLGSIAVAPAGPGGASSTATGAFGGTMVAAGLGTGARVMLPVLQSGALLFLGHGLAGKGDGVVTGTGIETPLEVEFTVEVVKRRDWPHSSVVRGSTVVGEFAMGAPRIESGDYLMVVGSGPSLAQALQHATIELHHWLDDDFGLNEQSVSVFMGQALEYEVASLAEPHVTVVAKVRKSYLPRAASVP